MIYEVCEGKTQSEAMSKAEALRKREPEARIVHTKTESISSMMGLKKEKIHKIIVAIPEYRFSSPPKELPVESVFQKPQTLQPAPQNKLSALEQAIADKRALQNAANPQNFADSITRIAEKVSLFEQQGEQQRKHPVKKAPEAYGLPFTAPPSPLLDDMLGIKSELKELKALLAAKTSASSEISAEIQRVQALPDEYEIYRQHLRWMERYLTEREFSRSLIDAFTKELEKDTSILTNKNLILAKAKEFLKAHIPTSSINLDEYGHGDTIVLVGPTGVGKTSTLAKFAAHFGFTRKKSLRFLSIDRYKVGAESQLEKYAGYMKARFSTITKQDEFLSIVSTKEADYTFVDTAGKSPKESTAIEELARWLASAERELDIHLVVSATTKNADLAYISQAYEAIPYGHIIVTKLDETKSYGSVLSMAFKTQKPFSFFTDGQEIPQDFSVSDLNKMISESLD